MLIHEKLKNNSVYVHTYCLEPHRVDIKTHLENISIAFVLISPLSSPKLTHLRKANFIDVKNVINDSDAQKIFNLNNKKKKKKKKQNETGSTFLGKVESMKVADVIFRLHLVT